MEPCRCFISGRPICILALLRQGQTTKPEPDAASLLETLVLPSSTEKQRDSESLAQLSSGTCSCVERNKHFLFGKCSEELMRACRHPHPGKIERKLPPKPLLLGINLCFVACFPDGMAEALGIHPVLTNPLAGPSPSPPAGRAAAQQKVLTLVAPWPPVLGFHQKGSAVICGLQAGNTAN